MPQFKVHKFVASLPAILERDAVYFVRAGDGFDMYVTNSSGAVVSYALNKLANPMTARGDLIVGGLSGTPLRVPIGGGGQVLSVGDSGIPTWVNPEFISVEYLVVGAGGSGGPGIPTAGAYGSGGGAGGDVRTGVMVLRAGDVLPVVIGAGGVVAATGVPAAGENGGDSRFGDVIAPGGGGGAGSGSAGNGPAKSGGNGGGGSAYQPVGASSSAGGFRGGDGATGVAGGGAGAGANGGAGKAGQAGAGGAGALSSITGTPARYGAGGGAGGSSGGASFGEGGDGGGGSGGRAASGWSGTDGLANTGGGGGGSGGLIAGAKAAGKGGSGVAIMRYRGVPRVTGGAITQVGGFTIHTFIGSGNFEVGL